MLGDGCSVSGDGLSSLGGLGALYPALGGTQARAQEIFREKIPGSGA